MSAPALQRLEDRLGVGQIDALTLANVKAAIKTV